MTQGIFQAESYRKFKATSFVDPLASDFGETSRLSNPVRLAGFVANAAPA